MGNRRYRAPTDNGAILADPPIPQWAGFTKTNSASLHVAFATLRNAAREELAGLLQLPETPKGFVLTGHQPELFHPGVWVKNFALNRLARATGTLPLHLIVDNDTIKSASIKVPHRGDNAVSLQSVSFDQFVGEIPYETCPIHDATKFARFPEELRTLTRRWKFEPLAFQHWPSDNALSLGERFSHARRHLERTWGCNNHELTVSQLCQTQAFAKFVTLLADDHTRFRDCYNKAVQGYRHEHGLRSKNHPVPDLQDDELPFWDVHGNGQRTRATVNALSLPSSLRPRALALTLFARLFLSDFFIHGIGGGKYDEVTDRIILNYFKVKPPRFAVLTATLHLPFENVPNPAESIAEAEHRLRDMHWNPQRTIDDPDLARLFHQRRKSVIAEEPSDRAGRKRWFRKLRELVEEQRFAITDQLQAEEKQLRKLHRSAEANAILTRRDYPWVLHPAEQRCDLFCNSFSHETLHFSYNASNPSSL